MCQTAYIRRKRNDCTMTPTTECDVGILVAEKQCQHQLHQEKRKARVDQMHNAYIDRLVRNIISQAKRGNIDQDGYVTVRMRMRIAFTPCPKVISMLLKKYNVNATSISSHTYCSFDMPQRDGFACICCCCCPCIYVPILTSQFLWGKPYMFKVKLQPISQ